MAICVLCGCEVNFLSQKVVHLCSTEQPLCGACWKRYDRADELEQPRLRDRILSSPHLRKRERVQEFLAEERLNMERRDRERAEKRQQLDELTARMKTILRCCDTPMNYLGPGSYRQCSDNLLLPAYERYMVVFECPHCGQIKFFNQDFVPAALREKEDDNG